MLNWRTKKPSQNVQPKYSDCHGDKENRQTYFRVIRFNDKEQFKKKSNRVITAQYGILSFLPLFTIEQLLKFTNQYFLFISILQQIPDASPVGRFTTILPLTIKFGFSAIKSIIKDLIKHIRDYKVNHKCVEVLRNGVLVQERWSEIGIGDIIKVKNNNIFPADLVLLSSSEPQGICHIETTHLDGEVNLKIRQCVKETSYCKELKDLIGLNGIIECELPNKLLYNFLGRLTIMNNNPIPLDNKQFLLRGSVLRNSKWIYGVVVYSGHETKIMLNQSLRSLKESAMETIHNSLLKTVFILIFFLSLMCALCSLWWTKHNINKHWYLEQRDVNAYAFLLQSISFFVIFHNTIPVSYVYIEVVRFLQDWFINNDIDMYQEESNTPARVRSQNLNVELAKVKYIFSDKTGTLTKNIMKLKHCSIAGELYLEGSQNKMINNSINHSTKNYILDFLRIMSVCHTVIPEKSKMTDEIVYNASSPDEQALVIGSQQFGFTFHTRCSSSVTITTLNGEETYEILNIIEFTNSRKRMSVIVRAPDGQIKLFCKGADTGIIKRLSKSGEKYKHQSLMHLNDFARSGYRTLCFAYKNISKSFYNRWKDEYLNASTVLINRESAKNKVAEKIEKKLTLIGVTAIENKLQDNVPKTIQALMCAAIKIWILTGDKEETALHIGFSTTLITQDSSIIIFNESNLTDLRHTINQKIYNLGLTVETMNCTLIISGRLLKHALSSDLKMKFLKLCLDCKSVICYRMSPAQKAEIVYLVTKYTNEVTLAISDGSNDVPMLHNASIGVGVVGLDGLQAYNASDYSIAQFNYLLKLLFVHGAWNYEKITKMIYFYHYKTVIFNSLQLWFAIYSGWSGQVLFDRWNICTYKSLFTVSLPFVMGVFLTTCSTETRLKCPQLYYQTQNVFNLKMFWIWIINALFHSLLLFWLCLFIMRHEVIWTKGRLGDYSVFGNVIYTCTLVIVCFKAGLHIQSWSLIVHLAIWVSILLWISFIIAYNELKIILMHFTVFINVNEIIFSSSIFWITIIFTPSVVLLLDIVIITIQRTLSNDTMITKNGNLVK
ncbi:probable phospholipid-transporting ATPase IA isoform X2 [Metopolophium dirhodum]|uniref:probable phospholipid-transporting ATPase IA isoform X2 n=1 Tax=Metopolophium dirhodum TaxID=44670 RepID=UPI00298F6028|nr:probable phospholipid-transporting ATPase IA isoform X2 [Metopolophium dirhodum]